MNNNNRLWISITICVLVAITSFAGGYWIATKQLSLANYPASQFAMHTIQTLFVDPLQDETLAKGIVYGTGDPYSVYLTEEEHQSFSTQIADHYVGIGVVINYDLEINRVFPNSPAIEAGVKAGDYIMEVNGEDMTGKDSTYASQKIKGPEGTTVDIVFQSPGEEARMYTLNRREVKIQTVLHKMLPNNIAYIQILSFNFGTADEFEAALQMVMKSNPSSLILDLRNNGGGVLEETQRIAEYFLPNDSILFWTIGRNRKAKEREMGATRLLPIPFTVLVNEYSASASEVLSGAIQDYQTGTLIGERTYGKASIQRIVSVPVTNGAIKITVEKYLTPNKRNIMNEGIEPDFVVENDQMPSDSTDDPVMKYAIEFLTNQ